MYNSIADITFIYQCLMPVAKLRQSISVISPQIPRCAAGQQVGLTDSCGDSVQKRAKSTLLLEEVEKIQPLPNPLAKCVPLSGGQCSALCCARRGNTYRRQTVARFSSVVNSEPSSRWQ